MESVFELCEKTSAGELDNEQLLAGSEQEIRNYGAIFMGQDSHYKPVQGWNNPNVLGRTMAALTKTWVLEGKPVDGGIAVFNWLAEQFMMAYTKIHIDGDDPDSVSQEFAAIMADFTAHLIGQW